MLTAPDPVTVGDYVSRTLGVSVIEVLALAGSVANNDFRVQLEDRRLVVVKIGPANEMAADAWACRRLADADVPVPDVLHLELEDGVEAAPTLIVGWVNGVPSDDAATMATAGRVVRRVHAVQLPGWGPLVVGPSGSAAPPRGRHSTWRDAVLYELRDLPELVAADVIDSDLATRARKWVLVDALLGYDGPGVLLHHDLKAAHLFAVPGGGAGELAGIIDWGDARVGDPVVDLARLSMTGKKATDAFADGYGTTLTPALMDRMARYRILWNVAALSFEYRAGGDWFDVYRQRIVDDGRLLA